VLFFVCSQRPLYARLSTLSPNDPFPAFSTHNPHDFLYMYHTSFLKHYEQEDTDRRIAFSVSPFYQRAKNGANRFGCKSSLGDINGPWNAIGLMYGDIPCGKDRGPTLKKAFQCAQFCQGMKFCGDEVINDPSFNSTRFMHDPSLSDTSQRFGFLSVPIKYRKVGVRFDATGLLTHDIGINILWGIADITQTTTGFRDLSINFSNQTVTGGPDDIFSRDSNKNELHQYITQPINQIFKELGLDASEFHESSIEDLQASMFWRHAFTINSKKDKINPERYPQFLFIPFLSVDGTLAVGKKQCPSKLLARSFGNNGHHALGFNLGFDIDFFETVEIGISGGGAYFFNRDISNLFVPTHELQSTIFPFSTDVNYKPGNNWHFTALMNAYHFIENLSFHVQYIYVSHSNDKICLLRPNTGTKLTLEPGSCPTNQDIDPESKLAESPCGCTFNETPSENVFKPYVLEKRSSWSSQMLDVALNYDIAPQASLGILWQIPIKQRNAYRSNTLTCSFEARF